MALITPSEKNKDIQSIASLTKGFMIAGTILATAIFGIYFFGHFIPIHDVQHILNNLHQIPNMTGYVITVGVPVLGTAAFAYMIRSVLLNGKKKENNDLTKMNEEIELLNNLKTLIENLQNSKNFEQNIRITSFLFNKIKNEKQQYEEKINEIITSLSKLDNKKYDSNFEESILSFVNSTLSEEKLNKLLKKNFNKLKIIDF